MSRNNKTARNLARAKQITQMHASGEKGPSRTATQHGKKSAWWQIGNGDYATFVKGKQKRAKPDEATEV